ncbi:MAG: cyclic nucleotide-binding domain-containing protein [Verrucomicrobia subdivision 3 bacterium]|nr:cyclic nucleotide-binding domain-containing protein [Limisphaerales bacterium]
MVSLETTKLFAALPAAEVRKLSDVARERRFRPGDVIFREGDPGDGLYVVKAGKVQISAAIGSGERHVFWTVLPGDVFGEMAVLDNLPRSAQASAEGETTVIFVPRDQFIELLKTSPAMSLTMVQEFSRRLREFNQQYISKLLQVERMALVGRFASTIVHDLKNPLTIIRIGAAQAANEKSSLEDRKITQKRIESQIERITGLVNDILEFTRGTPQQIAFARLEFDAFVQRIVSEFQQEIAAKGITLQFENQPPATKLAINPQRLGRVFYNIIFNAVDVMPNGGVIRLRFNETNKEVVTEIEDSGPGISPEIADRLFEPFATFGKPRGTGLGLSISQRIVEEHRGRISGRNQPGGGAIFSVALPKDA